MINYSANKDNDMAHVKGPLALRQQIAGDDVLHGVFGDSCGGRSFTDEEAKKLESRSRQARSVGAGWHDVWAGPGCTRWTIIDCRPDTEYERELYEEAMQSM